MTNLIRVAALCAAASLGIACSTADEETAVPGTGEDTTEEATAPDAEVFLQRLDLEQGPAHASCLSEGGPESGAP